MAALNAFDRDILIYLPGVPQPVVEWAVLWAARAFCAESTACRRDVSVRTVAGVTRYEIDVDEEGAEPALIIEIKIADRKLVAGTDYLYDEDAGEVVLAADPDDGTMEMTVAVQPSVDASVVPDLLLQYANVIAAGARQKIAAMPGQTWTNPEVERKAASEFRIGQNAALVAANKANTRASLRIQPRRLA